MALEIKFIIDGQTQLMRELGLAIEKIKNPKEFHQEAIELMSKRSDEIFKNKGMDVENAQKWPKLSATTLNLRKARAGHYANKPNKPNIMRWTGRLQEDTTKKSDNKQGSFTHNAPYAIKHQRGIQTPKRVVQDLDSKTKQRIQKALQEKTQRDFGNFGRQI